MSSAAEIDFSWPRGFQFPVPLLTDRFGVGVWGFLRSISDGGASRDVMRGTVDCLVSARTGTDLMTAYVNRRKDQVKSQTRVAVVN